MFYGEYQHTLDSKSRVFVPAKFREELGNKFIITKGLDSCLFAFPAAEWESIVEKMKTVSFTDDEARSFMRFFFAGACECEMDKQGRVLIAQNLKEYASLDKDICIVGVSGRVEIWDKGKWDMRNAEYSQNASILAKKMALLGI